jgi:hypothetical protein
MNTIDQYSAAQKAEAALIRSFWQNYLPDPLPIGFVANVCREDGFNIKAIGDKDTAFSIGQWHWQPRGANILKGTGIDVRTCSIENALTAMHWELTQGPETAAWAKINICTTATGAAQAVCKYFERAGAPNALALSAAYATMWETYFATARP